MPSIYDLAPAVMGLIVAIGSYVYGRIIHDRAIAARDARRLRERQAAE